MTVFKPNLAWKRFWLPRGNYVDTQDGFLTDPDSWLGKVTNAQAIQISELAVTSCVIALGAPGTGKSHVLHNEFERIKAANEQLGDHVLFVDLHSVGSIDQLYRKIFDNAVVKSWLDQTSVMHLFLDSYDECRLRLDVLPAVLRDEISAWPCERLKLRIGSRPADWSPTLEQSFRLLWGDEGVVAYELAPLRRADVLQAAESSDIDDPEAFLKEVSRAKVGLLASKPITLGLLIMKFRRSGSLPSRQTDIYWEGCRLLCEETEGRFETNPRPRWNADQRMAVAARIAAVTVLANREAVWTGIDQGDVSNDDVQVRDLVGGAAFDDAGEMFSVDSDAVRESLNTGLLTSFGPYRLGWVHRTLAEFLAAQCLSLSNQNLSEIMGLLIHQDGRIFPQLHETAAWLAAMRRSVFQQLIDTEPDLLLRSDISFATDQDRKDWCQSLLDLYDKGKISERDWYLDQYFPKLCHSTIAAQIRPFIEDRQRRRVARRAAIGIAEACRLQELQQVLASIALASDEIMTLRVAAAFALAEVGHDSTKAQLLALLDPSVDDPDDELKGCALIVLWPGHLLARQLFDLLTPPKNPSRYGAYQIFLSSHLLKHLQPIDLPIALEWVNNLITRGDSAIELESAMDDIVVRAWDNIDVPGVETWFARVALLRLQKVSRIFDLSDDSADPDRLAQEPRKRKQLVKAILRETGPDSETLFLLTHYRLVHTDDIAWIVQALSEEETESTRQAFGALLSGIVRQVQYDQMDEVLELYESGNATIRDILSPFCKEIRLDSPEAEKLRDEYQAALEWQRRRDRTDAEKQEALAAWRPAERVATSLANMVPGGASSWIQLIRELAITADQRMANYVMVSDVTSLPGWSGIDDDTRKQIVDAAADFVMHYEPRPSVWVGTTNYVPADYAGYQALVLLQREAPNQLCKLTQKQWALWGPVVTAFPALGDHRECQQLLIEYAYRVAASEVVSSVKTLLRNTTDAFAIETVLSRVDHCWDASLGQAVLEEARRYSKSPQELAVMLKVLLLHEVSGTYEYAVSILTSTPTVETESEARATVATTLLIQAPGGGWTDVWPAIRSDVAFGRTVILRVAWMDHHHHAVAQRLSDEQLADLYIWVANEFPHEEDPPLPRGLVSSLQNLATWRDMLLSALKNRGTVTACNAITRIAEALPRLDWMQSVYVECQTLARRRAWTPVSPADVLKRVDQRSTAIRGGVSPMQRRTRLFIVHGHDEATLLKVKDFLQNRLGFPEPVILNQLPSFGRTIIEKFEDHASEAQAAVIILTPDDETLVAGSEEKNWRARQNVIFELGFFYAKLGRKRGRVILLHKGDIEMPSNISGIGYVDMSDGLESAMEQIRSELSWAE